MKTILMTVPTCSLPAIVGLNFVLANVGWLQSSLGTYFVHTTRNIKEGRGETTNIC